MRSSSCGLLSRVGERRWAVGVPAESVGGVDVPSPRLDLGGIAKGYTADACRDLAVSMGARGVLVSVGTSSVSVSGTRLWRSPCRGVRPICARVKHRVKHPRVAGIPSLVLAVHR